LILFLLLLLLLLLILHLQHTVLAVEQEFDIV